MPDRWADAAFELVRHSFVRAGTDHLMPTLRLEPIFRRSHGLYQALARALDAGAIRDPQARHRPDHWPLLFAVDASSWVRCDAETRCKRGVTISRPNQGRAADRGRPALLLDHRPGLGANSKTAPMDASRIRQTQDATDVPFSQLADLMARLGNTPCRQCSESTSVNRVHVEHLPKPTGRTKKPLWLWAV